MNGVEHTYGAFDGDRNVLVNAQSNKSPSAADQSHSLQQKTFLPIDIVASFKLKKFANTQKNRMDGCRCYRRDCRYNRRELWDRGE